MNRIVVLGVAIFFALVGIALIGGEQSAEAGLFNRGGGGYGCDGGCDGGCHGRRHGRCNGGGDCCSSKHHDSCSCNGGHHGCNGGCGGYAEGGKAVQAPMGEAVQK